MQIAIGAEILEQTASRRLVNATQEHNFEIHHNDGTVGIDLTNNDDYVRQSSYTWYDTQSRQTTSADYGSGDTASVAGAWKYATVPGRPSSAPSSSSNTTLVTKYQYNASTGDLDTVTDPAGVKTATFYDDLNRRTFVAENQDNFTGAGDETDIGGGTNNEKDRVTKWEYNGLNQVTTLRAYNGSDSTYQDTTYHYEDSHNASLVSRTVYPDSTDSDRNAAPHLDQVTTTYNLDGRQATMTDQRGVVHTYTYDNARRLSLDGATTIPAGVYGNLSSETDAVRSIARTYTDLGEPLKITSYSNSTGTGTVTIQNEIEYEYNYLRLVSNLYQSHQGAVTGTTPKTTFNYDPDYMDDGTGILVFSDGLHRTTTGYPFATGAFLEVWFGGTDSVFDRIGRAYYQKLWGGTALNGNLGRTFIYEYNGVDRLVGISDDGNASYTPNLKQLRYSSSGNYDSYDRFGRAVKQRWIRRHDSDVHDEINYGYDYAGNRQWREDVVATANSESYDEYYNYDGLHRLTVADRGDLNGTYTGLAATNFAEDWSLDQLGNWSLFTQDTNGDGDLVDSTDFVQDRLHNSVNEIDNDNNHANTPDSTMTAPGATLGGWQDPTYDAAGNTTAMPKLAAPTTTYTLKYDAWNRLVLVRDSSTSNLVAQNEYDGRGQRIQRIVPSGTHAGTYAYYYNDQWQLLTETKLVSSVETTDAIYHWHPFYIDALATRMRASDTHHFLHDGNFNVTAAVDDSTDAVVERYQYTPYGQATYLEPDFDVVSPQSTSAITNNHLYTGREVDPETKLQLNRNRYYSSHLGRWLTRDPIGYEGSRWNLYEYLRSSSVNFVDPTGLQYGPGYPIPSPPKLPAGPVPPPIPTDPTVPPGPGWQWMPPGSKPGSGNGNWYDPETGQSLNPDLNHPAPKGPHWGWTDPYGNKWDFFPDTGKWKPNEVKPNRPAPQFPPGTLETVAIGITAGAAIYITVRTAFRFICPPTNLVPVP